MAARVRHRARVMLAALRHALPAPPASPPRRAASTPRRVPRAAWAAGVALSCFACACNGLLGEVELETRQLTPAGDGAPGGEGSPVAGSGGSAGSDPAGSAGSGGSVAPACEEAERRCVEGRLERCNVERSGWELVDRCATPALCELTRESGSPICELPRCLAGERRCRAETLTVCNTGLTGFDDQQVCDAPVLCDPASGGCRTSPCEAGERRCNGAQIEACNAARTAFEPLAGEVCASAALCAQSGDGVVSCRDPVCAAGEFRCVGAGLLQRCSPGRDGWEDVRECAALEVCDPAFGLDGCQPAECQSGERRCGEDELLECRPSRDGFDVIARCGSEGCDAVTSECRDPCLVGVRRCAGASVEECTDPLVGWEVVETCPADALCDVTVVSGCRAAACAPGELRCAGADLERCNATRSGFELVQVCASEALCVESGDDARCEPPACAAGERECRGRDLAICNAERTGFDEITCGLLGCNANADPPDCRGLLGG